MVIKRVIMNYNIVNITVMALGIINHKITVEIKECVSQYLKNSNDQKEGKNASSFATKYKKKISTSV